MADIVFSGDSDFSKVKKDFDDLSRRTAKLEAENYKLKNSMDAADKGARGMSASADKVLGDWKGYTASLFGGITSVTAAVGFVVDQLSTAMEEANQLRTEQKGSQITVAGAQAEVDKMLGDVAPEVGRKFKSDIEAIAVEAKFPDLAAAQQAAADVLSATAGNQDLTKSVLRYALPLQRAKPEEVPAVAGAIADIASMMGAKSDEDVKRAVAMTVSAVGQARLTKFESFKEAAQSVAATTTVDSGADRVRAVQEGAALFAAVSGAMKDPTGALTKTAVAEIATQLEQLLPEKDVRQTLGVQERAQKEAELESAKGKLAKLETPEPARMGHRTPVVNEPLRQASMSALKEQISQTERELTGDLRKGTGMRTLQERLRAVQASPALQEEFWKKGDAYARPGFRGPVAPVIKSLLANPESEAAKRYNEAVSKVTTDEGVYDRLVARMETGSNQQSLATRDSQSKAVTAKFDVGADLAGRRKQTEEIVDNALLRTRMSGFDRVSEYTPFTGTRSKMGWDMRGGAVPEEAGLAALGERRAQLEEALRADDAQSKAGQTNHFVFKTNAPEMRGQLEFLKSQMAILEAARPTQALPEVSGKALAAGSGQSPAPSALPLTGRAPAASALPVTPAAASPAVARPIAAPQSPAAAASPPVAAPAVDLSGLQAANAQQLQELQAMRRSIERMGEGFGRTANRLAGVAARSDLRSQA